MTKVSKFITLLTLFFAACTTSAWAQDYTKYITVEKIVYNQEDCSYTVHFNFSLYHKRYENFDWYLSYKGKRVSDYYSGQTDTSWKSPKFTLTARSWPDEVPVGNEIYVTVQIGKEPKERDRRDDDY